MDRLGAALLFAFGLFWAYHASRLPMHEMSAAPGPGVLPLALGAGIAALSLVEILRPEVRRVEVPHLGRVLVILAALVAYALLLERLGFVATTFLVLAALFLAFAEHGRGWLLALSAAIAVGTYFAFRILLKVPLPPDPLDLWR